MACCASRSKILHTAPDAATPVAPHCKRFFQWVPTDNDQLARAEAAALAPISGLYTQSSVAGLNTVSSTPDDEAKPDAVLLHGFAGGAATWVANWRAMSQHANVHAVDMPGWARSARHKRTFDTADEAIDYFVTGLEQWFSEMDFPGPVVLVGHSFGGYVVARFTMKHPDAVAKLIMCDPWGVNRPNVEARKNLPFRFRVALKLFDAGNPLAVLRAAGPWGPTLLPKVRKDFAQRYGRIYADPMVFYNYVFHCNADSRATGEAGFKACSGATPASAKFPLIDTLPEVFPAAVPLRMIYGADTWMNHNAGSEMCEALRAKGHDAVVSFVPQAAHQLMIDNVEGFNEAFVEALLR